MAQNKKRVTNLLIKDISADAEKFLKKQKQ